MKVKKRMILTMSREYGSGGHAISEYLSKALNVPLFDKNIITIAAQKSGMDETRLIGADENPSDPFYEPFIPYGTDNGSLSEKLFRLQSAIIKEKAQAGSGIFVGRCANSILSNDPDLVRVYIYAPELSRIERIMKDEDIRDSLAAQKILRRIDKKRRSYYQFYSDMKWGSEADHDLMINSSVLGIDGTAKVILSFLYEKGLIEE